MSKFVRITAAQRKRLTAGVYIACVRRTDRIVEQIGLNAGDRTGCDSLALDEAKYREIKAALAEPNGGVTLSVSGVVATRPHVESPFVSPDQAAFDTAIAVIKNTYGKTRTPAQIDNTLDAISVVMRRMFRELVPPAATRSRKSAKKGKK